jgi:hypothetical protein
MREAVVLANVDSTRLHSSMCWIQARPIATEMAQMPLVADESILLLLRHFKVD